MIRTRTLLAGVFVILPFLLPAPSQAADAQEVPCDNSQAESLIPRNEKGQPLMPKEIQDNAKIKEKPEEARLTLTMKDIRRCLESSKPLKNHVIDFDRYVAAWMELKDPKPALLIEDSVLWSFKEKGQVNLAAFTKKTKEADEKVTDVVAGKIEWHNVTLGPSFSAREIKFPQGTSFNSSRFPNRANFLDATFGAGTSFKGATFGAGTSFKEATFGAGTRFDKATFGNDARFDKAIFGNKASFWETTFGNNPFFWEATFGDAPFFFGATFGDKAYFARATFGDDPRFFGATFCDKASFELATFGDDTRFDKAIFAGDVSFSRATLGGDINLRRTTVKGKLDLGGTNWEGRANFRKAEIQALSWNSKNYPSEVKGIFDAREAKFKKAVIKEVRFSDLVDFSDVEFGGSWKFSSDKDKSKTDSCGRKAGEPPPEQIEQESEEFIFQNLIFEKEVDFLRATFRNDAIFVRNRFRSVWDLTGVKFQRKEVQAEKKDPHLCLSFNLINKLFMEREHLSYESSWIKYFFPDMLPLTALKKSRIRGVVIGDGSYSCSDFLDTSRGENETGATVDKSHGKSRSGKENEKLWEIYQSIESSFRVTNDRLAANEAWYLNTVAYEESQYSDMEGWRPWIVVEYWALLIFADFPSRYGIDLYRVVLVSSCLVLFFAIFYAYYFRRQIQSNKRKQYVKLKPRPDQKRAFRFRPFERFSQSGERQKRPLHPLKDALFLSGRAFFKLGLGTAYPRTRVLVWIVHVEWILGMYMLIHFLLAVKNTLPIAVPFLTVAG